MAKYVCCCVQICFLTSIISIVKYQYQVLFWNRYQNQRIETVIVSKKCWIVPTSPALVVIKWFVISLPFVHKQVWGFQPDMIASKSVMWCVSISDRPAEDPPRSCAHIQSQDRLHQHLGRRAAGGNAVSVTVHSFKRHFKAAYLQSFVQVWIPTLE